MSVILDTESKQSTRRWRNYSDHEKAKALAVLDLCNGNLSKASRNTNVPLSTIKEWNDGRITPDIAELRNTKRQALADRFEDLAHLYIDQANATYEASKGTQAIVGAATATDKMRLLRDQSTVNVAVHSYAQTLINWASSTNADQATIDQKLTAIADANSLNLADLRAAVLGQTSE